jgi:hypothetical protein
MLLSTRWRHRHTTENRSRGSLVAWKRDLPVVGRIEAEDPEQHFTVLVVEPVE